MKRPVSTFNPYISKAYIEYESGLSASIPTLSGEATGVGSRGLLDSYTPGFTIEGLGAAGGILDANFTGFNIKATENNAGVLDSEIPILDGGGIDYLEYLDTKIISIGIRASGGLQIVDDFPNISCTATGVQTNSGEMLDGALCSLCGSGSSGWSINASFPVFEIAATAKVGYVGTLDAVFSKIEIDAVTGGEITGSFFSPSVDANGNTENVGIVDSDFAGFNLAAEHGAVVDSTDAFKFSIDANGNGGYVGTCSAALTTVRSVSISGTQEITGNLSGSLPRHLTDMSGVNGNIGGVDADVSSVSLVGVGLAGCVGVVDGYFCKVSFTEKAYSEINGELDSKFPCTEIYSSGFPSDRMDNDTLEFSRCL